MKLVLTGRNVEVSPAIRRLVERKLAKLDRLRNVFVSAQVVLEQERHRHLAEITIHARGDHMLHGVAAATGWEMAVAGAVEKIGQQLQRVKGKWQERKRRSSVARRIEVEPVAVAAEAAARPRVRRASRYPVKPMTVEEAALAIDGSRDTFLVFRNASTDQVNVVYRRKDGGLGLIEPES